MNYLEFAGLFYWGPLRIVWLLPLSPFLGCFWYSRDEIIFLGEWITRDDFSGPWEHPKEKLHGSVICKSKREFWGRNRQGEPVGWGSLPLPLTVLYTGSVLDEGGFMERKEKMRKWNISGMGEGRRRKSFFSTVWSRQNWHFWFSKRLVGRKRFLQCNQKKMACVSGWTNCCV